MIVLITLISLILCCPIYTSAQSSKFATARILHYDDENGLPQNSAKEIIFDESGFLWIGTESGLVRYDGRNFRPAIGVKGNKSIDFHFKDTDGNIYFYDVDNTIYIKRLGNQHLTKLNQDGISAQEFLFPSLDHNKAALDSAMVNFYFLSHYLGADNLITWESTGIKFIQNEWNFREIHYRYFVLGCTIFKFYNNGNVEYRNADSTAKWNKVALSGNWPDADGDKTTFLSLLMAGGESIFSLSNKKIYRLTFNGEILHSEIYIGHLPFDHINSNVKVGAYDAKHDIFAFGSKNQGLFIVSGTNFNAISTENSQEKVYDDYTNVFYSQAVLPDNKIITGTGFIYDKLVSPYIQRIGPTPQYNRTFVFDDKKINATISNMRTIKIKDYLENRTYQYDLPPLQYNGFKSFAGTTDGNYYFAIETDLFVFYKNKTFAQLSLCDEFKTNQIRYLFDYSEKHLLIISNDAILTFDKQNSTFDTLFNNKNLGIQHIFTLNKEKKIYLLGTHGNGYFGLKNEALIPMPQDVKRYLKYTHTFIKDFNGFVWISTNKGLFQVLESDIEAYINHTTKDIYYHYYDKSFGFETNEFNGRCLNPAVMTYDSMFSFSSMSGLVHFYPQKTPASLPDDEIFIDLIKVDSLELEEKMTTLALQPDFKSCLIKISSPYYGHRDNLHIEYRVMGLNSDWQTLDYNNEIKLQNMSTGNYTLHLRKKSGFGVDNRTIKTLDIFVNPYYYQTWWFYSLLLISLISLTYGFSLWYNRFIRKQKKVLINRVQKRTTELIASNEILQVTNERNNMLMSILAHDIKAPMKLVESVTENLKCIWVKISDDEKKAAIEDVSKTSRKINQFISQFLLYITAQNGTRQHLERFLLFDIWTSILSFHDFDDKIVSGSVKIINKIPQDLQLYCEKEFLKIALNNILENSIKYSYSGHITIESSQDNKYTSISISDQGKGMSSAEITQIMSPMYKANNIRSDSYRLGFLFIKDMVSKLNGQLEIISHVGKGTTIIIKLGSETI